MQNENNKKRFAGRGYYIALIACIAAVGISGYVFVNTARQSAVETSAEVSTVSGGEETGEAVTSQEPAAQTAGEEAQDMGDSYEETMGALSTEEKLVWPLEGAVAETFSQEQLVWSETMEDWRTHEGIDIAAMDGDLVCASQDGTVTAVYEDDYLGSVVVVSHEDDVSTLYANLMETPSVAVGQTVSAGDVIGQVGGTALLETAQEPHLHFEVFRGGNNIDPLSYLPQ